MKKEPNLEQMINTVLSNTGDSVKQIKEPKQKKRWLKESYDSLAYRLSDSCYDGVLGKLCSFAKSSCQLGYFILYQMWDAVSFGELRNPEYREEYKKHVKRLRYLTAICAGCLILSTSFSSCSNNMAINQIIANKGKIAYLADENKIAVINASDIKKADIPKAYILTKEGEKERLRAGKIPRFVDMIDGSRKISHMVDCMLYSINNEQGDELYIYALGENQENKLVSRDLRLQITDFYCDNNRVYVKTADKYYCVNPDGSGFAEAKEVPLDSENDLSIEAHSNDIWKFREGSNHIELRAVKRKFFLFRFADAAHRSLVNLVGINGLGQITIDDTKIHSLSPVYIKKEENREKK